MQRVMQTSRHKRHFWGRSLVSSIVELEDISIRQLQHIRTNYLCLGVTGGSVRPFRGIDAGHR